jgi:hypothetical protein
MTALSFEPTASISSSAGADGHIGLYGVTLDGFAVTAWWSADLGWNGWFAVADGGPPIPGHAFSFHPLSPLLIGSAPLLSLFGVAADGQVWSTAWSNAWSPWFVVGNGTFDQPSGVCGVDRFIPGHGGGHGFVEQFLETFVDLWAIGQDGQSYTAVLRPQVEGFQGWTGAGIGVFHQGTVLEVVLRTFDDIDLFAFGEDGRMYTLWYNETEGPVGWLRLDAPTAFEQGTRVTAIARTETDIDLFAIGADGRLRTLWWSQGTGWRPADWTPIGNGTFASHTPVALFAQSPDALDLFAIGMDGKCYTLWWTREQGWNGWFPIGGAGVFTQLTPISVVSRGDGSIDLFAVGEDGEVYTLWWTRAEGWNPRDWTPIFPAGGFLQP